MELKASELRIGNWIYFCYMYLGEEIKRPVRVTVIEKPAVLTDDNGKELQLPTGHDSAQYIPLTPDIITRCGFHVRMSQKETYWLDGLELHLDNFWWYTIDYSEDESGSNYAQVDYLHQLQNLYFALTQTEININL